MALFEKKTIIQNEIDYDKLAQAIKLSQTEIDYNKLAKAIVEASKAEEIEKDRKRKQTFRKYRKRYRIIKDTSNKGICVKVANSFRSIHGFLNYNKVESEESELTFEMIKGISAFFFWIIEISLIIVGYLSIIGAFSIDSILERMIISLCGFSMVFLASVFRVIRLEVSAMKDKECINIVFSSIMAFGGVLLAFASLLMGRN